MRIEEMRWCPRCSAKTRHHASGPCARCVRRRSNAHREAHKHYARWTDMKSRCHNPEHRRYADYGGRGIAVCDAWRNSYQAYEDYILELGPQPTPKHTLDRTDNDGNYEPGNLRWATPEQQRLNKRLRRDTVWLTHQGRKMTQEAWAREVAKAVGIHQNTALSRIRRQGIEVALAMGPACKHKRRSPCAS